MCIHRYKVNGKEVSCDLHYQLKTLDLVKKPLLDNEGLCLFHTEDRVLQKEHQVFDIFKAYLTLKDTDPSVKHHYFDGINILGDTGPYGGNDELLFEKTLLRKSITFINCRFLDHLLLEHCVFADTLYFDGCTFTSEVSIMNSTFREDVTIENCTFISKLGLHNYNRFRANFQLLKNTFLGEVGVDNGEFDFGCYIEDNIFDAPDESTHFNGNFKQGMAFRNNDVSGLLSFQDCIFRDDSIILDGNPGIDFDFDECTTYGTLILSGTPENFLFGPNTTCWITESTIEGEGRVIFDYCNLLNLSGETLKKLHKLEKSNLVKINDSCKLDRLKVVIDYDSRDVTEYLIEDLNRLVVRYFRHLYATHLSIEMERSVDEVNFRITYSTREKITTEEFDQRLSEVAQEIFFGKLSGQENRLIYDLQRQTEQLLWRLRSFIQDGELSEDLLAVLTSFGGRTTPITINLNQVDNVYNINGGQIGAVGTEAQSHNNQFFKQDTIKLGEFDQEKARAELAALLVAIGEREASREQAVAYIEIQEAQTALDAEDTTTLSQRLGKAGKYAFDIAKDIGVEVAAALIQQSMGM